MKKVLFIVLVTFLTLIITTCGTRVKPPPSVGDIISFAGRDWIVLANNSNRAKILSVDITERRPSYYTHPKAPWTSSELRSYLNNTFLNTFRDSDRVRILETVINNPNNHWFASSGGANTQDRIFLLSIEEVVKYFGDSRQLENRPNGAGSINDQFNLARTALFNGQATCWWLRSPGRDSLSAAGVCHTGRIQMECLDVAYGGVRPALWLQL